ncbi:MAG: sugar phosphate isomerase/epimerase [Lentisphaeria bacterium]|nr:sugar phosphate isomerase/epimerase [Lentisphaeria bacterium]
MKIGVIAELLRKPLDEDLDFAGNVLKVDGVQLYAQHPEGGIDLTACTEKELETLQEKCRKLHLVISAVCGDVGSDSFQVESQAPARVEMTKKIIDNTARLGVKVVTTHIGHIPESRQDPVYPVMLKHVRILAEYAASKGCVFAIETGPELADVLRSFIEEISSPGIGVNLDPANLRGVSCVDPVYAVKTLAPYIVHTHAKDALNLYVGSAAKFYELRNPDGTKREISARPSGFKEVPLGQGMVPWDAYIAALREIGYKGFLTVERECGEDPVGDIVMAVDFLRNKLA